MLGKKEPQPSFSDLEREQRLSPRHFLRQIGLPPWTIPELKLELGSIWRCPLFWTKLSEKISFFSIYGVMVYSACPLGEYGSAGEQPERRYGWMTEGQSLMGSAFLLPAPPDSPKALNSG
jgi:hypothetical protein